MKKRIRVSSFDVVNYIVLFLFTILVMYPMWYTILLSITNPDLAHKHKLWVLPIEPTLLAYETILAGSYVIHRAYANTIYYSVLGTFAALVVGAMAAYPLTFKKLRGRSAVMIYLVFTMFFSGGLIPTYLLIRGIGLGNTVWALVLPPAVSVWHIILIRTNFQQIPVSLSESAYMDGAQHWTILFKIILPLSKAIMATIALFTIVGRWNQFFAPLLYLDSPKKWPLQVVLRNILMETNQAQAEWNEASTDSFIEAELSSLVAFREMLKSAALIVSIGPIIIVYPFIQKYFVKGTLIGSLKG